MTEYVFNVFVGKKKAFSKNEINCIWEILTSILFLHLTIIYACTIIIEYLAFIFNIINAF